MPMWREAPLLAAWGARRPLASRASAWAGGSTATSLARAFLRFPRELRVAAMDHEAQPEDQGVDLARVEHQRRQEGAGPQHIAEPRLALDWHALGDEGRDVAIDGARRHAEFRGENSGGDGPAPPAQRLDQVEQAGGAGHRSGRPCVGHRGGLDTVDLANEKTQRHEGASASVAASVVSGAARRRQPTADVVASAENGA